MMLAGANATFAPTHVLAAVLGSRASAKIGPRITGVRPLETILEVAELRVHDASPLGGRTLADLDIRARTGAHVVGRWQRGALREPPAADEVIEPGTILVAVGTSESIESLAEMARPLTEAGRIIVIGYGTLGRKLAEILAAAGEELCVVGPVERPGVDIVGDIVDPDVLERVPLAEARVAVLALETDSATVFAATVLRDRAPDLPIIAGVSLPENVTRIQRAGVDFALSLSQVAGQLLLRHVLGETVSLQPRIQLVRVGVGSLEGKNPVKERVRERTGCTVVAVEREGRVAMDFPPSFELLPDDVIYICGTASSVARYHERFPASRL